MNGAPIKIIQHFNSYFIILTLVYRNKNAYFWFVWMEEDSLLQFRVSAKSLHGPHPRKKNSFET
jgi:hypothetical protein